MSVELKVVTTCEFEDMDVAEEFLRANPGFEPNQVIELLEEGRLEIIVDDPNELVIGQTKNVFTLKEE